MSTGPIAFSAQILDPDTLSRYILDVNMIFDALINGEITVAHFVDALKEIDEYWIAKFAEEGYRATGGFGEAFGEAASTASRFINSFADNFGTDLAEDLSRDWRWRALMYPREGARLAYVLGQQAAMKERGAKAWQRVLHPESSVTGPCDLCVEDSMVIHPIEEPFESLHPGEVCTVMESIAYYPQAPEAIAPGQPPMIEMPTPAKLSIPGVIQMLKDTAGSLGKLGLSIIRRIRRD